MSSFDTLGPFPDPPAPVTVAAEPRLNTGLLGVAAVASAGAGLVHAAAAGTHTGDITLVRLFALTAAVQVGWAALAALRPSRAVALAGLIVNSLIFGAWALSRTVGLPLVDSLREVEEVGTQDLIAAILAGVAAGAAGLSLMRAWRRFGVRGPALAGVGAALLLFAVPGMTATHTHGPSHEHGHGEEVADGHAHAEAEEADDHPHAAGDEHAAGEEHPHDGPVTSLDDPAVTDEQRAAAQELIDASAAAMAAFPTVEAVEAAGYESIGDSITGYEHFIKWDYMDDGVELDPERLESVVFEVKPDGRVPVSAMYILDSGKTMDDVPDVAGPLTVWHDHQDLCWDSTGKRVTGLYRAGRCIPGGELRATAPMLHVWLVEQECGWFAGIEGGGFLARLTGDEGAGGHGGSCEHGHGADGSDTAAGATGRHAHGEMPARLDHEPTAEQLEDARELVLDTRAAVAKYADTATAEAAGYRSIGDGRTGVEHYVNRDYLENDTILDPEQPESLVYKVEADGSRTLATAMYILPPGSTMDDVPDVAGNLTMWHGHDNLCFDPTTGRLSGLIVNGSCVPGGVQGGQSPMLHVWLVDNPCGPFAGADRNMEQGSCVDDFEI